MTFEDTDVLFPEAGVEMSQINPAQLAAPPGQVLTGKGSTLIAYSASNIWLLKSFLALKTPIATSVLPSDLGSWTIQQAIFDPFGTRTAQGAYLLASDGTNSAVWHTSNVAAPKPTWTKGATVAGQFKTLRAGNAASAILIYAPDAGTSLNTTYDFTVSDGGFTAFNNLGAITAQYSAGNGWTVKDRADLIQISSPTFSAAQIVQIKVYLSSNPGGGTSEIQYPAASAPSGTTFATSNPLLTTTVLTFNGNASLTSFWLNLDGNLPHTLTGVYITKIELYKTAGATVRYSSDYGASWGSEINVGAFATGATGFDVQRAGTNSFAACSGKVRRATTLGGAYSDYYAPTGSAQAACVILPYYKWGSTTVKNTNATNPDIVVGLSAADASSRTLLWIEGGATPGTVHDITPVANYIFSSPNAITTSYGTAIATIGAVSGAFTLRTSTTLGGAGTWNNRGALTAPTFIRTRRNDTSILRSKGQLYLTDQSGGVIDYSGRWGTVLYPRTMPVASGIIGFDILDG